jgi:hypothetical protein
MGHPNILSRRAGPPSRGPNPLHSKERLVHKLNMPAGSTIRLTATARPETGVHRWAVQVHGVSAAAMMPARIVYGSQIGGQDREQRIDIPAQDVDCRLELRGQHALDDGEWQDDRLTVLEDTLTQLDIGFFNPAHSGAHPNDVLLSFAFAHPRPQT